jgi:hypothetical protein
MRPGKFLNFLNLQGKLEDKARVFAEKGRYDSVWAFNGVLEFLQVQIERFNHKEITAGTIRNYVKSIKLFCLMMFLSLGKKLLEDFQGEEGMLMIEPLHLTKLKNYVNILTDE